jgi:transcriptional antiterminator NusG
VFEIICKFVLDEKKVVLIMAKRWYSISVLSNYEKKIAEQILHAVEQEGLSNEIEEVLVPTEEVLELRRGKKVTSEAFYAWLRFGKNGND